MRRALAHQVRQVDQAAAADWHLLDILVNEVVGVAAEAHGLVFVTFREVVAEPAQREARRLRDAHDVPAARHGAAEGVHAALRVDARLARMREDDAARADCREGPPVKDDARADSCRCVVTGTADNDSIY